MRVRDLMKQLADLPQDDEVEILTWARGARGQTVDELHRRDAVDDSPGHRYALAPLPEAPGQVVGTSTETVRPAPEPKTMLTDAERSQLVDQLVQVRLDCMFDIESEREYVLQGFSTPGLLQMSDEDLLLEWGQCDGHLDGVDDPEALLAAFRAAGEEDGVDEQATAPESKEE